MKVSVVNLGCKVNRVESDTISLSYLQRGASLVAPDQADVIVVNTCTVTGEAEKKTRKCIRRALRENDHAQIVVTGCAAAISPDFFAALDSRICVVDKADLLEEGTAFESAGALSALSTQQLVRSGQEFPTRVGVKVQDGCNHACTYCIVHVARGRAWSRPVEAIEQEVRALIESGVKEFVLTGIDLGSYSFKYSSQRITLAGLLRRLLALADACDACDVRFRVSSIEPRSVSEDFIELLAQSEGRVCRHLHLPLQSGSDKVLRDMHRPYRGQDFCSLVDRLYKQVPELSLTTDVIVGFPGETDQDFQTTCDVCREMRFSKIHVFRYSKREGTPAAARDDQIDAALKEQRARTLLSLSDDLRYAFSCGLQGKTESIVVEKPGWGTTESYYKARFDVATYTEGVFRGRIKEVNSDGVLFAV